MLVGLGGETGDHVGFVMQQLMFLNPGILLGKGNEDKRGQPITESVCSKHWLYLNGYGVVCTRQMEVAAIVSGINPSISATIDSVEMGSLQQVFELWHEKTFFICEDKGADQLHGNRTADQGLCFRYIVSTIPLLPKSQISTL